MGTKQSILVATQYYLFQKTVSAQKKSDILLIFKFFWSIYISKTSSDFVLESTNGNKCFLKIARRLKSGFFY